MLVAEYRLVLEDILDFTDGKRLLTARLVAEYLGINVKTARKRYGIGSEGIHAVELARALSGKNIKGR